MCPVDNMWLIHSEFHLVIGYGALYILFPEKRATFKTLALNSHPNKKSSTEFQKKLQ
jgi:hypothetical protein